MDAEADANDHDQRGNECLQVSDAEVAQDEDEHDVDIRHDDAGSERYGKQQVQSDRHANDLGEIAGNDCQLAEDPEADVDGLGEVKPASLREIDTGSDSKAKRGRLEQHGNEV